MDLLGRWKNARSHVKGSEQRGGCSLRAAWGLPLKGVGSQDLRYASPVLLSVVPISETKFAPLLLATKPAPPSNASKILDRRWSETPQKEGVEANILQDAIKTAFLSDKKFIPIGGGTP